MAWTWFKRDKPMRKRDSERLQQLENELIDLKSDLEALNRKHYKLSGAYYSRFGAKAPPTPSPDDPQSQARLSSDEILARAGYRPGKPMPKPQENSDA